MNRAASFASLGRTLNLAAIALLGTTVLASCDNSDDTPAAPALAAPVLADIADQSVMVGDTVSLTVRNTGGGMLSDCTLMPAPPAGLAASVADNMTDCEIKGSPTGAASSQEHTLTATNASGSSAKMFDLEVTALPAAHPNACGLGARAKVDGYPIRDILATSHEDVASASSEMDFTVQAPLASTDPELSVDNDPSADVSFFFRGDISKWEAVAPFILEYTGKVDGREVYQANFNPAARNAASPGDAVEDYSGDPTTAFKLATNTTGWGNQLFVPNPDESDKEGTDANDDDILVAPLALDTAHTLVDGTSGLGNNSIALFETDDDNMKLPLKPVRVTYVRHIDYTKALPAADDDGAEATPETTPSELAGTMCIELVGE